MHGHQALNKTVFLSSWKVGICSFARSGWVTTNDLHSLHVPNQTVSDRFPILMKTELARLLLQYALWVLHYPTWENHFKNRFSTPWNLTGMWYNCQQGVLVCSLMLYIWDWRVGLGNCVNAWNDLSHVFVLLIIVRLQIIIFLQINIFSIYRLNVWPTKNTHYCFLKPKATSSGILICSTNSPKPKGCVFNMT